MIRRVLVDDAELFRKGEWKRRANPFLGDTLLLLDGKQHGQRRRMLQPSLVRSRVAGFAPAIAARAERAQAGWRDGARIRLRDELDPLALVIVGDVLLSADLSPRSRELAADLFTVMAGAGRFTSPLLRRRRRRALARTDRAVSAMVAHRRSSPGDEDDLMGALLRSGLPDRTVRRELIVFLFAAVDEPPSALEAAWYLLGANPMTEERLHAELDSVLGEQPARLEHAPELPFLDAVLSETLRLFPPTRHIDRCPREDLVLDGHSLRAGENVIISPLVTHREPGLHDRAAEFVPERWLANGRESGSPPGAYLPFGAGAYACIGAPLARAIMTTVLATIARRWRLRVDVDAPAPTPRGQRLSVTLETR